MTFYRFTRTAVTYLIEASNLEEATKRARMPVEWVASTAYHMPIETAEDYATAKHNFLVAAESMRQAGTNCAELRKLITKELG